MQNILKEKEKIENPINHILIPRLIERKPNNIPKKYNYNYFLGNKRYLENDSESKNIYLKKNKQNIIFFFSLDEYEENKELIDNQSSSLTNSYENDREISPSKNHNNKINHIKCFICGKYGHYSTECRDELDDICIKCLQKNHKGKECPNEKCFLCNNKGHKASFCPLKKKNQNNYKNKYIASKIPKCIKCLNNGHESIDCLIKPNDIKINNPSKLPLCKFCNSPNHYICPFKDDIYIISDYDSDNVNIDDEKRDKNYINKKDNYYNKNYSYIKNYRVNRNSFDSLLNYFINENKKYEKEELIIGKIVNGITKEKIYNTNFCGKCGKLHYTKDCGKFISKKKYDSEDNDDYYIKLKSYNNIYHKKNPLKFEPFQKSEYRINHHDIRFDYYEQNDSSGESFKEMYNNKK